MAWKIVTNSALEFQYLHRTFPLVRLLQHLNTLGSVSVGFVDWQRHQFGWDAAVGGSTIPILSWKSLRRHPQCEFVAVTVANKRLTQHLGFRPKN